MLMVFRILCADFLNQIFLEQKKERGRHIYVLMHGHALFLKHPDKLFEAKLWTYFFLICSIFRGFRDSLCVSQLT